MPTPSKALLCCCGARFLAAVPGERRDHLEPDAIDDPEVGHRIVRNGGDLQDEHVHERPRQAAAQRAGGIVQVLFLRAISSGSRSATMPPIGKGRKERTCRLDHDLAAIAGNDVIDRHRHVFGVGADADDVVVVRRRRGCERARGAARSRKRRRRPIPGPAIALDDRDILDVLGRIGQTTPSRTGSVTSRRLRTNICSG